MSLSHRPCILIILDGWGCSDNPRANAIKAAHKPHWDAAWRDHAHTLIDASGASVGLPAGQMGNSEVGHMNIGSGRVVHQDFTRITQAIDSGGFYDNEVLEPAFRRAAETGRALHVLGLLSPGGVHSHQDHIHALLELARRCGVGQVYLHAFLDGRDTPPKSAADSLRATLEKMRGLGGSFAGICGRYYAMDRNNNWDRVRQAYELVVDGAAPYRAGDPLAALEQAYARGETDEFVKPTAIAGPGGGPIRIADGDLVVFANFRADRARQLTQAFTDPGFKAFARARVPALQAFISMTRYKAEFGIPAAFPPERLDRGLGEYLAELGLTQLRIAETEKYAHVTFFFNGGEEKVFPNEDRRLMPSPDVATYDLKPEMSAYEVTDGLIEAVRGGRYDVIICNFANADMVGHTGNFDAAVKAIEAIDDCLGRIIAAAGESGGEILITADHGNAEQMLAEPAAGGETQAHTAHTSNLVPFLYIGRPAAAEPGTGALCDIAPTLLKLMGLDQPAEMTGRPLFELMRVQGTARQRSG